MNRRRKQNRGLTDSRIYPKRLRYYLFAPVPLVNPDTGKSSKWHSLCPISDGEFRARELAKRIWEHNRQADEQGDMPRRLREWMSSELKKREAKAPRDPARRLMHDKRDKDLKTINEVVIDGFAEFDVTQVMPVDIAAFVDQWEGRRMGELYHSHLSKFFQWACRKGYRTDNPVREVKVEKAPTRKVYMTDEQFHAVRDALLIGDDGKRTQTGEMVQCYVDLCYLLYQRTTEIRLLKWSEITDVGITFKATKTAESSGASVIVPITPAIAEVLSRARGLGPTAEIKSVYVIRTKRGQSYAANGLSTAWKRACKRAAVTGVILKDLRAKALTDAKTIGYEMKQIAVGAAHTDTAMTEHYIRHRLTPVSEVTLGLPARTKPSTA